MELEALEASAEKLRRYVEARDFSGFDPYDALESPLLRALSLGRKWPRIFFIQALKRSPLNLRPLLGVRPGLNPKGLGLFLWGYTKLYRVERRPEHLTRIRELIGLLDSLKSEGFSGNCWGYNFDWQSRAFYVPRHTPTIVNSSFIGHALIDAHLYAGEAKALDMAAPIADFILNDLNRDKDGDAFCFGYTPIDRTFVHNANLLGASLLIRLFRHTGKPEHRDAALAALEYSMRRQRDDGSWPYAETDFQAWIDSFHTGFNLQSIRFFLEEGFAREHEPAFKKGVEFYANNFFLDGGAPKYYHDRLYPIDVHSPSQALAFFSKMGGPWRALARKVARWMIENLQDPAGYFYFQKHRRRVKKIPYMRWGQAWAFHGLTELIMAERTGPSSPPEA